MTVIIAQTEVLSRGAEFGPLGWVLAIMFVGISIAATWYARYVIMPSMEESRKTAEADRESKKVLSEAVAKLCVVVGETNEVVRASYTQAVESRAIARRLLHVYRVKSRIYEKLAEKAKVDLAVELGELRGLLEDFMDLEYSGIPPHRSGILRPAPLSTPPPQPDHR